MANPSWLAFSSLRFLCIVHGIEVQNVSTRTLYNWRQHGVSDDDIDLLALRLRLCGHLSPEAIADLYLSCEYVPSSRSYACFNPSSGDGLRPKGVARP